MSSSDERREVARMLREAKRDCERRGYPWMCDDLCLAIGYEHDYEADNGIFDRLADLIDPTCRVVIPNEMDGECFCSECGALLGEYGYTAYCPSCGARCVDNGGGHAGDD